MKLRVGQPPKIQIVACAHRADEFYGLVAIIAAVLTALLSFVTPFVAISPIVAILLIVVPIGLSALVAICLAIVAIIIICPVVTVTA
jgi:hypothetical protein